MAGKSTIRTPFAGRPEYFDKVFGRNLENLNMDECEKAAIREGLEMEDAVRRIRAAATVHGDVPIRRWQPEPQPYARTTGRAGTTAYETISRMMDDALRQANWGSEKNKKAWKSQWGDWFE